MQAVGTGLACREGIQTAHEDAHRSAGVEKVENSEEWSPCWHLFWVEVVRADRAEGGKYGNYEFGHPHTPSNPSDFSRQALSANACLCTATPVQRSGAGLTGTPPSLGEARGPPPEGLLHSGELGLIGCQPCQLLPPDFPSRVKPARPKHQDLVQILALSERLESRHATDAWVVKTFALVL